MRVGFTGTQLGMTRSQATRVIDETMELSPTEAHHGMCVGSDEEWHRLVTTWCEAVRHGHPPSNDSKMSDDITCDVLSAPKPYLERNHDIVDAVDRLIAAPHKMFEELRSGTWSTIRYARKLRRPTAICWPDGSVTRENWPQLAEAPVIESLVLK